MIYTKKPVEIQAVQFTAANKNLALTFASTKYISTIQGRILISQAVEGIGTSLLIGDGDYLVKGSNGSIFVMSKEEFEKDWEVKV